MKLLCDMPVSPRTVAFLKSLGFEATRVSNLGMSTATDAEIVRYARQEGFTILTEDLDFGAILGASSEVEPGVVILRVGNLATDQINERLRQVLIPAVTDELPNAVIIVERHRVRIRRLPIG